MLGSHHLHWSFWGIGGGGGVDIFAGFSVNAYPITEGCVMATFTPSSIFASVGTYAKSKLKILHHRNNACYTLLWCDFLHGNSKIKYEQHLWDYV